VAVETAVEVLKAGAQDYVSKDQLSRLGSALDRDLSESAVRHEAERLTQLTEALNRINQLLLATLDPEELFAKIAVEATQAVGAHESLIVQREGEGWRVSHVHELPTELIGELYSPADAKDFERVAETRRPLLVDDTSQDRRTNRLMDRYGMASAMLIPVIVQGLVIAVVNFSYPTPSHFDAHDKEFAQAAAAALSLAVENSRLFERQKRAAELSRVLNDVYGMLSVWANPGEVMGEILRRVSEALGAQASAYVTLQEAGWLVEAAHGLGEDAVGVIHPGDGSPMLARAAATAEPVIIPDARKPGGQDVTGAEWPDHGAYMLFPLRLRGRVSGAITFLFAQPRARFLEEEVDFVERLGVTVSLAMENERLYAQEHRIAGTLQQSMLWVPEELEGVELGHKYESATEEALVGGDFYDIFEVDERRVALVIGDVSGKGLEASAMTSLAKDSIRAHIVDGLAPGDVLAKTSEVVFRFSGPETFVTGFAGLLDRRTGALEYSMAGHPPPIIVSPGAEARSLPPGDPLLGAFRGTGYETRRAEVAQGDTLIMYTDGLIEARSDGVLFGEDRLRESAAKVADRDVDAVCEDIFAEIRAFAGGQLRDDAAIVAVRLPKVERR
jgi:GAF domain-containing protein